LASNPGNRQAGRSLCALYESDGLASELILARAVCVNAVTHDPIAFWAWSRLGRYQRGAAEYADAVISYQNALRGRPRDATGWEELGEAYNAQGKYIAGLKALTRAVELRPTSAARYQLASTQLLLGLRTEAVTTLRALVVVPSSSTTTDHFVINAFTPAVKMLADSYLSQANAQLVDGAFTSMAHTLQRCIATGEQAVVSLANESKFESKSGAASNVLLKKGSVGVVSIHKLLGDAYAMYRHIPASTCVNITGRTQYEMLTLSDASYAKALEISPATSSLWYDRAIAAHAAALAFGAPSSPIEIKGESKAKKGDIVAKAAATAITIAKEWHQSAITYAQRAISLEPNNSTYWNALGVVDNRPAMRQHAFIKACRSDARDAVGWANLGVFYLQHNARELSRKALEASQRLDPNLAMVWLGQALFNHSVGGSIEAWSQAHAAFARALELTPSWTARLGVGVTQWHLGNMYDAEYVLRKALEQTPTHPQVLNLYGMFVNIPPHWFFLWIFK
jgi:superkiller protein 3